MRLPLASIALAGAVAFGAGPVSSAAPAPPAVVDAARSLELADDPGDAAAALQPYVAQHPDDAAAGLLLGDLYFRTPDLGRAEAAWKSVLAAYPRNIAAHARLGGLYASVGRLQDAADQYAADMPSPGAAAALVDIHQRFGDLPQFVNATGRLADENRFDPDYVLMEATVLEAEHRPAAAIGYFDRVVALRRGRCDERIERAKDELELQRSGDAIDDLQRCLATQPASFEAMAMLGAAYLTRKQPQIARTWIDRALQIEPDSFAALVNRAVIEEGDGAWQAAMRDDRAAIAADPMAPEGYANFASDLLERGALANAQSAIEAGLRALPRDGRLHFLLGRTYAGEGRPLPAVRAEYVAALDSDEPVVVRAANEALRALGTAAR